MSPRRSPRQILSLTLIPLTLFALSGCTHTVALEPGSEANDPGCAEIIVRLPDSVGEDLDRRQTNAQATSAWGDPSGVLLRCGIEQPEISSLACLTVGDVDWLIDESDAPIYRFETYGRIPATEVIVDTEYAVGATVLTALERAVSSLPATKRCESASVSG